MHPIRLFQRPFALFLAILIASSSLSCYSRYNMQSSRLPKIQHLKGLEFVLIDSSAPISNVWVLSNPKFEEEALFARLDRASEAFGARIASISTNADRKASQDLVMIYINPSVASTLADTLTTRLEYKNINKIEVFEPDAGKVVGIVLGGITGCALISIVALFIACNCPHVYTQAPDGSRQLEGSLYSGAIYPQLERSDYLALKGAQTTDNQLKIILANQESQHQHTNLLALEVLDHAPGFRPVFDKYGQVHTIATSPQSPIHASDVSGKNVLAEVLAKDENVFLGDLSNQSPDATEKLSLRFAKPNGAKQAKLLLNAKNSQWLDYTYFEFQNALGEYADEATRKYRQKSAAANQAWAEKQKIPLAVWLETRPGQWEKVEQFDLQGASVFRDAVLPLDLSGIPGNTVNIRLEFGFHFWEIDQVALDFSENQAIVQTTLRPVAAHDQAGKDITASILEDDTQYYDQPAIGDEASIRFELPPLLRGLERSLVLRGKGHYEVLHQNAPGRPNPFKLKSWEKENALPKLARERWLAAQGLVLIDE